MAAPRGDLDEAVSYGESVLEFDRMSIADIVSRAGELDRLIQSR